MDTYRRIVIGSTAQLPVRLRDAESLSLETLSTYTVTVTIAGPSGVVVDAGVCETAGTLAWYTWATAGVPAGEYRVQFTFTKDGVIDIEPARAIPVTLVASI